MLARSSFVSSRATASQDDPNILLITDTTMTQHPCRPLVGPLMYAAVCTTSDVARAAEGWFIFYKAPFDATLLDARRVQLYLVLIQDAAIKYGGGANDLTIKRPTDATASPTEADSVVLHAAAEELLWLRCLLGRPRRSKTQ
ncbi:uncharacterized protein PHALS_03835 [Plasmopara halstedii]|uniref:Uncharacterized protein n=1 Tax=Plasmopara halstedii TaxID=4781 RepID=A0A0P1AZB7_PLAHL|nr:uncharacterized protein PHALS_03835 [Plasmopara halstedii]CEG47186.1 hypothetical protein PHALS_03835 [Plasmopara halstedii]|eukprot:XP_024583555.1 hypothetical protein PHALS_03835 [Plasmopara halstedii]